MIALSHRKKEEEREGEKERGRGSGHTNVQNKMYGVEIVTEYKKLLESEERHPLL